MRRYNRLVCGLLAALLHHAGWADQNDAHQALIDQGNFWMARDDGQRAAEAWNKLLLVSPENAQALYGLAHVELQANRPAQARAYLQRLQRIQPNGPLAAKLEQELSLGSGSGAASIEEARRLAAAGKLDEAVARYKQVLGSQEPVGDIGREYYTYLGYTDGGLPEAIAGLRRLAAQSPGDARIQLALARHLARGQNTRAEGVRSLAKLASRPDVGKEATQSWREALTWMTPTQTGARALFDDYLEAHPDDAEIRRQLQRGVALAQQQQAARSQQKTATADPLRQRTDAAMKLLEAGDAARARAEFQAILAQRPNYADALGGLGVVAMRERDWPRARDYLTRARRGNAAWQSSLDSVQYWVDVDKAQALLASGNTAEARKVAARAAKREPKEVAADAVLADILLREGKTQQAVQAYRKILGRRPGDAQALQGLGQVARMSGDYAGARRMLEDALAQDPEDPWLRYQLAKLYQSEGHAKEARGLLDGLLMTRPNDPETLYASALLASDSQQWEAVRELLARIPPEQRTAPMNQLYGKADLQARIAQAVGLADAGRKPEALNLLGQVRAMAGNDFDTLNAVAQAYVQIGEAPRGLALLQPLRAQGQARSADASIAYAGLLLASRQDVEASIVLRHLHTQNLTGSQRASLDELTDAYRIRQADLLTERRDLVAAYDMLAPVLQKRPNDPGAMAALARMYASAGQGEQAMQMYETLLRSDPDNPNLHLGLAQVAQQLGSNRQAERSADAAVSLAPENIEVLTAAARVYRASGKSGDAAELLNRALALRGGAASDVPVPLYAAGYASAASANPFVGLPGQRTSSALDGGRSAAAPAETAVAYPMGVPAQIPVQAYAPVAQQGVPHSVPPPAQAAASVPQAAYPAQPAYAAQAAGQAQTPYYAMVPAGASSFAPSHPAAGRPGNPFADPRAVAYAPQSELARELAAINEERSPYLTAGTEFRTRGGEAGTSKLEEFKMPLEASMPAGNGRVKVQLTPITLSSGSLGDQPALAPPPAGMEIARLNPYAIDNKTQTGVGVSVGYQTSGMELDAGVTPLGFRETDFTGGALFQGTLDDAGTVNGRVDISRRPVTDSVLSFAGRRYEDEDLEWGGVSATGARVTLSKDFGQAGVYGAAAWHTLRGNNVESNSRREFNVGTYFHLVDKADSRLTAGVNFNAAFYDKNLGQYTYGHGGYFSPQNYYALSVPVTWAQRSGRMSYRIDGAIGVQSFKEDDAPVFPTRPDLQAQAQRSDIPTQYGMHGGTYPGQSKTGVAYNLKASAEYRLDPQLALGATLGADNANDYKQWMGGFYLRYYFHPQSGLLDLPIEPSRSPYGNTFGR